MSNSSDSTIGSITFTVKELEEMLKNAKVGGLVEIQLIPKVVIR
jgi:hypothetical protein